MKRERLITVLTPVYNRKNMIGKLYESLINQTSQNFKWLIIDDGSTDGIDSKIKEFKKDNIIDIEYYYQENGGKHRALNNGINRINTILTFIVDSDDYLTNDAIEKIERLYQKYKEKEDICGFSFLRKYPDEKINGPEYPKDEFVSDYIECRLNQNIWGDKAEIYYTKLLKEYSFLEVPNENFLMESYVWTKLALKYKLVFKNDAIYIGEYQSDGLTNNSKIVKAKSPIGVMETAKILCNTKKTNLRVKSKAILFYIAYGMYTNKTFKEKMNEIDCKFLFLIMYPFGLAYKKIIDSKLRGKNGRK